jgi:RNA polymerase sigma-70 factor (ECF subfamily)
MKPDEELVDAVSAGDERAFAQLYERHRGALFLFAARMLGSGEAARDLVQETFLALWERRHELERLRSFRGWLFTAGRNRCLTTLRQRQTRARLDDQMEQGPTADPPPAVLESEEESRLVRRALDELAPEQREVLILREYQEMSYREIAGVTGASESAVKARLFRARQALAARLGPALTRGDEP